MELSKIDLHDAILRALVINYGARTISIEMDFYLSQDDRDRKHAHLLFEEVEFASQLTNLKELEGHTFAGHVNYWVPALSSGTTFIYLVVGTIAITASKVNLKETEASLISQPKSE